MDGQRVCQTSLANTYRNNEGAFDSARPTSRDLFIYNKKISYSLAIMYKDRSTHTHDGHDDTQAVGSAVLCWVGVIGRHLTALTGDWSFRVWWRDRASSCVFQSEYTVRVPELSETNQRRQDSPSQHINVFQTYSLCNFTPISLIYFILIM